MTVEELISLGKDKVRSDSNLMSAYIQLFTDVFGRKPDCAGCTFRYDWERLVNSQNNPQTQTIMAEKTFLLVKPYEIFTYFKKDDKTNVSRAYRTYGHIMTEEFAENYLTQGTEEQISERKRQFKILPAKFLAENTEEVKLSSLTKEKLTELAVEKGYSEEEYKSLKKNELVAYLEAKKVETTEEVK